MIVKPLIKLNHLALLTGILCAGIARAETAIGPFTVTLPPTRTVWESEPELPRFDPDWGTLVRVEVTAKSYVSGMIGFSNTGATDSMVTAARLAALVDLKLGGSPLLNLAPTYIVPGLPIILKPTESASFSLANGVVSDTASVQFLAGIDDLTPFVGPAGDPGTFIMDATADADSSADVSGNPEINFRTNASLEVTVTYYVDDEDEDQECGPCDGRINQLTLAYVGAGCVEVTVDGKHGRDFRNWVLVDDQGDPVPCLASGDQFTLTGWDKQGTLGTDIIIYVNGVRHVSIHTSCSQPVGPGMIFGDFLIVEGYSRNGGLLCADGSVVEDTGSGGPSGPPNNPPGPPNNPPGKPEKPGKK